MKAIDINIVVRFLIRDDEDQFHRARSLIEAEDCFVPDTVILETYWVLRSTTARRSDQILNAIERLLGLENIHVRSASTLRDAVAWSRQGMDFADAMHLAMSQDTTAFVTFDRRMVRHVAGLGTCEVVEPS